MTPRKRAETQPKRRPRGSGSIFEKGGKWYGRLRRKGEPELHTEAHATEEEAEWALNRLIGGAPDPRFLPSFEQYFESLIAKGGAFEYKKEAQTLNLYDTMLAKHVRGTPLGKLRLDDIRKVHVQRFIDKAYGSLSESSVRRLGSCVNTVLKEAVEEGLLYDRLEGGKVVRANPAEGIKYRTLPPAPAYVLSDQELVEIPELLHAYNPRLSAMVTVMADTGARPGEVCGMRHEDIRDGVWTIRQPMGRDGKPKKLPKTKRTRSVHLAADCIAAIAAQGTRKGYVFLNEDGKPVRPDALSLHLRRFRTWLQANLDEEAARLGIDEPPKAPPITPRNLRKTFVTRGVEQGDVKAVQAVAGHTTSKMTLDVYAQARQDPQKKLIESLAARVRRRIWSGKPTDRESNPLTPSRSEAG